MLAAAGIVVTEIRTPISAPDLAEVSDSIPAIPAKKATMKEKPSGWEMNSGQRAVERGQGVRRSGRCDLAIRVKRKAAVIPTGKPTASAVSERRASSRRRWTTATQRPASGPELRADDHRADDQDRGVEEDADRGDQAGEDHEGEEVGAQLDVLRGARLDLLPDDRVAGEAVGRPSRPRRRPPRSASRSARARSSRCSGMSNSRRSLMITLASSRATSQRITSPSGLLRGPRQEDQVGDRRGRLRAGRGRDRSRGSGRRSAGGPWRSRVSAPQDGRTPR